MVYLLQRKVANVYLQHDTEHHVPGGKQSGAGVHAQGSRSVTMTERERLFKPSLINVVQFYL